MSPRPARAVVSPAVSPVTLEVVRHAVLAIAEEMSLVVMRAARSPLLKEADLILSLDWVDLAGQFKALGAPPEAKVIQVTLDQNLHNGWSMDYQGLPPVDLFIAADPDSTIKAIVASMGRQIVLDRSDQRRQARRCIGDQRRERAARRRRKRRVFQRI